MKLLVGLGNFGANYHWTRHNAGFLFLDQFADLYHWQPKRNVAKYKAEIAQGNYQQEKIILAWPQTFMNQSGQSVAALVKFYRLRPATDLLLIYDDLDLPLGHHKLTTSVPHGHNGVLSVQAALGKNITFTSLRLGTDSRLVRPTHLSPVDYVLENFPPTDWQVLNETVFPAANQKVEQWLSNASPQT